MASFAPHPSNRASNDWTEGRRLADGDRDTNEELSRLRRENAELRREAKAAQDQRDAFSVVLRTLVLNPFADVDDLRQSARKALRATR